MIGPTAYPLVVKKSCWNAYCISGTWYDATANQYSYVWKTNSNGAGTCAQFELGLNDGSTHTFLLQLKK